MAIRDVTSQCWIQAMFIRSDKTRFLLGSGAYEFDSAQQHFVANQFITDVVDVHGGDGALIAGQVRRASAQPFDGYIGDGTTSKEDVETYRRQFIAFFQKNYMFEVVYVFPDGTAIRRGRGYIVDAPEVKELYQVIPKFHVSLNFEDVNYYTYDEDENGNEIYSQSANIPLYDSVGGGLIWDSTGAVFDSTASLWDGGANGMAALNINAITDVYPAWVVRGRSEYPELTNATTGTSIKYDGVVTQQQTLIIDMLKQTATLNGQNVISKISGTWVSFKPGLNRIRYDAENDYAPYSQIKWSEIIA